MDNNYTVYMHISPSGKRYIGITCQKPKKRWKNGKGYLNNKYFYRAIEKYGWDNFEHIIVAKGLSEEQAKWLEIELIRVWDSTNQDKGYNITLGGEGTNGWTPSEETRKKMSENHEYPTGENHPMYGKNPRDYMTEEAKIERDRKMSEAMKGKNKGKNPWENMTDEQKEETKRKMSEAKKGENNSMYGKNYRDYMTEEELLEHDRKLSEAKKGKNNPQAKSVITIINDKIFATFDCVRQGAEYFNCGNSHISDCCKGKRNYCGKYNGYKIVWRYITIIEL